MLNKIFCIFVIYTPSDMLDCWILEDQQSVRGSESGFESDLHIRKWDKAIENCADSLAARPPVVGDIARPGGQGSFVG